MITLYGIGHCVQDRTQLGLIDFRQASRLVGGAANTTPQKSRPSFWKGRRPMHRRNILVAVTLLGFALLPADAVAQQRSLKEQLIGAWTLVSMEATEKDGTKRREFGPAPKGVLILDAGGKY